MRKALRLATAAATLTLVLAFAENALATQRVTVSQTATSLKIKIAQDASDAQPAKVLIHIPVGVLTKAAPGERIGAASAHVIAHDAADARVDLQGDLRVGDPAKFLPNTCFSGEDEEAAVWLVEFPLAATRLQLAAFVSYSLDNLLGTGRIELCFGPPDVPAGTPGRSPAGAQLLDLTLALTKTSTPMIGSPQWTSFFTPFAAGTGRPDPAATVEARSLVAPGSVTVSASSTPAQRTTVVFSGNVEQAGAAVAGARVQIRARGTLVGVATSNANGTYRVSARHVNATLLRSTFRARVRAGARDITASGCSPPSFPNVPCVSATVSGFSASSRGVRVRSAAFSAHSRGAAAGRRPSATTRVLDRTLVCVMGQGWVAIGTVPDTRITPGVVTLTGNSAAGTFPFVGVDTDRGAWIDAKHCRSTKIRVPLTAKGLPGPASPSGEVTCPTPGRVLAHLRYEYLPGEHEKGYVGGRMLAASLAVRAYKSRKPLAFAKLTANGTKAQFFSAVYPACQL